MVRGLSLVVCVALAVLAPDHARAASPTADFSGAHVGLDTSYGFGAAGDWCFCSFLPSALDATGGSGGIIVGGEAGYGWRLGAFVVEGDVRMAYANVAFAQSCAPDLRCDGELSWLGEAEVSAGFVLNDILLVASAGYVAGDVRARMIDVGGVLDEETSLHEGHIFGARIEQGMIGGWRFGLEYRYYDMSGEPALTAGGAQPTTVDVKWQAHVAGLTIRYEVGD
jgi:hypothetical protein